MQPIYGEEFVAEYLSEIESLKIDGYWSNKTADLLTPALANYVNTYGYWW